MTPVAALLAAPVSIAMAFFVAPLALMVYRSVTDRGGALSIEHYSRFAGDPFYLGGLAGRSARPCS